MYISLYLSCRTQGLRDTLLVKSGVPASVQDILDFHRTNIQIHYSCSSKCMLLHITFLALSTQEFRNTWFVAQNTLLSCSYDTEIIYSLTQWKNEFIAFIMHEFGDSESFTEGIPRLLQSRLSFACEIFRESKKSHLLPLARIAQNLQRKLFHGRRSMSWSRTRLFICMIFIQSLSLPMVLTHDIVHPLALAMTAQSFENCFRKPCSAHAHEMGHWFF